jgi:site-specific recombinase XerD
MFLTKRSNGNYYIFYERNGKRTCISTKTKYKSEALKFLSNFGKELKERQKIKSIPISIREFMFVFFRYSETVHSPNTTETYKVTFKMLLNYLGDIPLTNLTHQILDLYFQERIRLVSIYVAQRDLSNISSFFNYAIRQGYALENPIRHFKRFKLPEKQPIFFTENEFALLVNAIEDEDLKDLATFAVQTGLRQMELITLQWDQINLVNRNLLLDNRNCLTKSKKVRNVPLSSTAIKILERRILRKSYGTVFTFLGKKIDQNFISHKFKKYIRKLPINPKLNFHSFRHTFASWLVQRGVSIYVVSRLLGHSDIKTTQIYAHLRSDDLLTAVEILNLN